MSQSTIQRLQGVILWNALVYWRFGVLGVVVFVCASSVVLLARRKTMDIIIFQDSKNFCGAYLLWEVPDHFPAHIQAFGTIHTATLRKLAPRSD